MDERKPIVLYICIDPSLGGSTASLYNLISSIKDEIKPIVLFSGQGVGYDFFVKKGIESYVFPFIRLHEFTANKLSDVWMNPLRWHRIRKWRYDYRCLCFVKYFLKGRKVDIVHSNTSPNDIGVLLAHKLHAKHVWHVREFCKLHFNYEIYGGYSRLQRLINQADVRIAISKAIKEYWNMPDGQTYVINNAVRSKVDACYCSSKDKYILFSSYILTEAKGTRSAIVAFAKSNQAQKGYRLKLMGNCSDEYRSSLLETIKECDIEMFVDFIPCQLDVKPYFIKATACIMASKYEAFGRVTAEAMFYGCPVIAHATGGTLDIIKDGETGYLFSSEEECAQLISRVCSENQEPLIFRAQKFAIDKLSQEVYGPKIIEIYHNLLQYVQKS